MGNVSSHTYTYAGKRSFACNCEENNGKCGLAPPNNRFERTHGTSPFAAQPNVRAMENLFRVILNQDFPSRHPDYVFRAFLDQILEIAEMSWRRKKLRSEMMHKGRNSAVYPDYASGCAFF